MALMSLSYGKCLCHDLILNNTPVQLYFSPLGGCTEAIVKEIGNAKNQLLVQAYSFTSRPIAKALLEAHKRGVKVEAIVDKSQRTKNYSSATLLANSRIPTFIDDAHDIAHNKIIIIDGQTVITGSQNWTTRFGKMCIMAQLHQAIPYISKSLVTLMVGLLLFHLRKNEVELCNVQHAAIQRWNKRTKTRRFLTAVNQ